MAIYSPYMKQCSCYKTTYLLEEKYLSYRRGCLLGEKGSMLGMEKGRAENEERGREEKGEGRGGEGKSETRCKDTGSRLCLEECEQFYPLE